MNMSLKKMFRKTSMQPLSHDFVLLLDTMYIMKGIQKRLPD
jgi:hypothetical protein